MRGGWGLDALGKFSRRRRRRRRRRRPPGFGEWTVIGFHYDFGVSGVRASIRLVFRVPLERELRKVVVNKNQTTVGKKNIKNGKNGHSIINLL